MPRVRITETFTFHPEGRGAIHLKAGQLFFASDEIADEWTADGRCQDESAPWPPLDERKPPILGPDGRVMNQ